MESEITPEPKKKASPLKNLLTPLKHLPNPLTLLSTALEKRPFSKKPPDAENPTGAKKLPIPKKLMIPVIAGAVLLIAGGAAFGLLHGRLKHATAPQAKAVASAPGASMGEHFKAGRSKACSGVVRDIYRQTVDEDPRVTLAEVRSEVQKSGIDCAPIPAIAAELKNLTPACRDMVQYTYLGVHDGHEDIKVSDIRQRVVEKSVACQHDRSPSVASAARHKIK